jgi:hypothetical protein
LFFKCPYMIQMWTWLAQFTGLNIHFNTMGDICVEA